MSGDTSAAAVHGPPGASGAGPVRTDVSCTECSRTFIALLDYAIDGNHIVECPHCSHEHCRVIEHGVITGERWSSRHQRVDVLPRDVWKSDVLQAKTSTASAFIRESWLLTGGEGAL